MRAESSGGVLLVIAAVVALIWANSAAADGYLQFWGQKITLGAGDFAVTHDLGHWVNDGLMVIFFFVIGLEIKRELAVGELRDRRAATLPAVAALGGVVVPGLLYALIAEGEAIRGWGIPMATDIAFAVGVLALLGKHVSAGAKLFLLSVAIVDDILAIAIIAIFYTDRLSMLWLLGTIVGLLVCVAMRRLGISSPWAYVPIGVVVWFATLESGVHATLAGVALGLLTPAGEVRGRKVLDTLEHDLHPVSAFLVVPIFALANAGVPLGDGALAAAYANSATWAVITGLVLGKIIGISGGAYLASGLRWGTLPQGMHPWEVFGVAALGGIGFTVSLFITDLAFADASLVSDAKVGILTASVIAALIGVIALIVSPRAGGGGSGREA
ncbi:Na+/H+ antiporter NhaA [Saccharopolyspora griseoalba]|uniref:Na(+)/H(+) antiporter NhaA n=1 Tax=Saccharopolyspora griseoalba TaxID=1431848 RepID=A0ABW2LGM7_9PSEU